MGNWVLDGGLLDLMGMGIKEDNWYRFMNIGERGKG